MRARLLSIDLSRRSYAIQDIAEEILDKYIGGRGLGAYLLYKLVPAKVDPLGEENHLIFSAGPASGTDLYYSSKAVLNTKSPLTNIYLYSVCSGVLAHQMKKAGIWVIDIKGIASSPTYVVINNAQVEFRDGSAIWGMKTVQAQEAMLGGASAKDTAVLAIGPAGENLVKYASIVSEGAETRSFARGGPGCVMGSKKLKGIVVHGEGVTEIGDQAKFKAVKKTIADNIRLNKEWAKYWRLYGTDGDIEWFNGQGILPTRNWQHGQFEGWRGIDASRIADEWARKHLSCGPSCPTTCAQYIEIKKGPYTGARCGGPEYETVYALGSNCGIDKFDAISAANQICNEYGIDTMSAGLTISFAMECFEKGLIGPKDTDGIELRFGSDQAMITMLQKIVNREGFGRQLAEGVQRLSQDVPGSEAFAMQTKGMEYGGYESRGLMGQALAIAIGNRGGCHHAMGLLGIPEAQDGTRLQIEGKGQKVKNAAIGRIMRDCIPICTFPTFVWPLAGHDFSGKLIDNAVLPDIVSALIGKSWTTEDMQQLGTRIICQERLFNMREGITRKDDTVPLRLLNEPKPDGPAKGSTVPLEELKDDYYQAMGWDQTTGNPPDSLLAELEIER